MTLATQQVTNIPFEQGVPPNIKRRSLFHMHPAWETPLYYCHDGIPTPLLCGGLHHTLRVSLPVIEALQHQMDMPGASSVGEHT